MHFAWADLLIVEISEVVKHAYFHESVDVVMNYNDQMEVMGVIVENSGLDIVTKDWVVSSLHNVTNLVVRYFIAMLDEPDYR